MGRAIEAVDLFMHLLSTVPENLLVLLHLLLELPGSYGFLDHRDRGALHVLVTDSIRPTA